MRLDSRPNSGRPFRPREADVAIARALAEHLHVKSLREFFRSERVVVCHSRLTLEHDQTPSMWAAAKEVRLGAQRDRADQTAPVEIDLHDVLADPHAARIPSWHRTFPGDVSRLYMRIVFRDNDLTGEVVVPVREVKIGQE
jgi:hypothetical protein